MAAKRILIGYDGSECAQDVLVDLSQAGLGDDVEAVVLAVAEAWATSEAEEAYERERSDGVETAHLSRLARRSDDGADDVASRGASILRAAFPSWSVHPIVYSDLPASGILAAADEWRTELIVVGTHGRRAIGRAILGSVSQQVLARARCSVRIARRRFFVPGTSCRIVVGVDGSPDASAAVDEVVARSWPPGTCVHVVGALQQSYLLPPPIGNDMTEYLGRSLADAEAALADAARQATGRCRAGGLDAVTSIIHGPPAHVLLDEAREWGADCVVVGARGHDLIDRLLLGSVSAVVAARAHCSVEVVRRSGGSLP